MRENQKKEDTGARKPEERRYSRAKVRKVANRFVFPMICQLDSWTGRSISAFALPSVTHNTNLSCRFPILETSATALCGTIGSFTYIPRTYMSRRGETEFETWETANTMEFMAIVHLYSGGRTGTYQRGLLPFLMYNTVYFDVYIYISLIFLYIFPCLTSNKYNLNVGTCIHSNTSTVIPPSACWEWFSWKPLGLHVSDKGARDMTGCFLDLIP